MSSESSSDDARVARRRRRSDEVSLPGTLQFVDDKSLHFATRPTITLERRTNSVSILTLVPPNSTAHTTDFLSIRHLATSTRTPTVSSTTTTAATTTVPPPKRSPFPRPGVAAFPRPGVTTQPPGDNPSGVVPVGVTIPKLATDSVNVSVTQPASLGAFPRPGSARSLGVAYSLPTRALDLPDSLSSSPARSPGSTTSPHAVTPPAMISPPETPGGLLYSSGSPGAAGARLRNMSGIVDNMPYRNPLSPYQTHSVSTSMAPTPGTVSPVGHGSASADSSRSTSPYRRSDNVVLDFGSMNRSPSRRPSAPRASTMPVTREVSPIRGVRTNGNNVSRGTGGRGVDGGFGSDKTENATATTTDVVPLFDVPQEVQSRVDASTVHFSSAAKAAAPTTRSASEPVSPARSRPNDSTDTGGVFSSFFSMFRSASPADEPNGVREGSDMTDGHSGTSAVNIGDDRERHSELSALVPPTIAGKSCFVVRAQSLASTGVGGAHMVLAIGENGIELLDLQTHTRLTGGFSFRRIKRWWASENSFTFRFHGTSGGERNFIFETRQGQQIIEVIHRRVAEKLAAVKRARAKS